MREGGGAKARGYRLASRVARSRLVRLAGHPGRPATARAAPWVAMLGGGAARSHFQAPQGRCAAMSPKSATGGGGKGGMVTPGKITLLVLVVLAIVFIFENTRHVKIRLLIPEVSMPLWLALLAMGVVGALVGKYLFRRQG